MVSQLPHYRWLLTLGLWCCPLMLIACVHFTSFNDHPRPLLAAYYPCVFRRSHVMHLLLKQHDQLNHWANYPQVYVLLSRAHHACAPAELQSLRVVSNYAQDFDIPVMCKSYCQRKWTINVLKKRLHILSTNGNIPQRHLPAPPPQLPLLSLSSANLCNFCSSFLTLE